MPCKKTNAQALGVFTTIDYGANASLATLVGKSAWDGTQSFIGTLLAQLAKIAARELINEVTSYTVDWIKGNKSAQPLFVADPLKYVNTVADQTAGDWFENNPDLNFLCDPFKAQLLISLQAQLPTSNSANLHCTLTDVTQNIVNAGNSALQVSVNGNTITRDVTKLDGSDVWLQWLQLTTQPQNNPVGAYVMAQADLSASITTAQGKKINLLNWGSGSLTYSTCIDEYFDKNGLQQGQSEEYNSEGPRPPSKLGTADNITSVRVEQKCAVKTPGAAITDMLSFKATGDQRMNELIGSLSSGFDQIFNALIGALEKSALTAINNGVLDNSASSQYQDALNAAYSSSQSSFYNSMANKNAVNIPNVSMGSTTWTYQPPPVANVIDTTNQNDYSDTSGLGQYKNNAISLLNSFSKSESDYQNTYLIAQNVLLEGEKVFASSSICNIKLNRADGTNRYYLINANVISNINGTSDSNRIIPSIPWNLITIQSAIDKSNANMAILTKAYSDIRVASSLGAITDAMTPVNSTSFNTEVQPNISGNIKAWLTGVKDNYNTTACPIDLTDVLQINSAPGINVSQTN